MTARRFRSAVPALVLASAALAGCGGSSMIETGSVASPAAAVTSKVDPACTTLAAQIDGLKKDGATERLEKAADGKGTTVSVQRTALTKQAQLNKANADFIAKCGPNLPKSTVAMAQPDPAAAAAATVAKAAAAAPAAAKAVPAVASGVTAVVPAAAAASAATDAAKAAAPKP